MVFLDEAHTFATIVIKLFLQLQDYVILVINFEQHLLLVGSQPLLASLLPSLLVDEILISSADGFW